MKQSEIVKKIEEFVEKEFDSVADIRLSPGTISVVGKGSVKQADNVEVIFRVLK